MTKKELNSYRPLERRLRASVELLLTKTQGGNTEKDALELIELRNLIFRIKRKLGRIELYITKVADPEIRLYMQDRFIEGRSWKTIANTYMGGDALNIRRKVDAHIKDCLKAKKEPE